VNTKSIYNELYGRDLKNSRFFQFWVFKYFSQGLQIQRKYFSTITTLSIYNLLSKMWIKSKEIKNLTRCNSKFKIPNRFVINCSA